MNKQLSRRFYLLRLIAFVLFAAGWLALTTDFALERFPTPIAEWIRTETVLWRGCSWSEWLERESRIWRTVIGD